MSAQRAAWLGPMPFVAPPANAQGHIVTGVPARRGNGAEAALLLVVAATAIVILAKTKDREAAEEDTLEGLARELERHELEDEERERAFFRRIAFTQGQAVRF